MCRSLLASLLVLAACQPAGVPPAPPPNPLRPSTFTVDTAVQPLVASVDGRAVSALTDASGMTADFVANEIIVTSKDAAAVDALAQKLHGTVVAHFTADAAQLPDLPEYFLLRVDPSSVSTAQLAAQTTKLNPRARGDFRFSDEGGMKLLAIAAAENAAGTQVILNFVPRSTAVEASKGDTLRGDETMPKLAEAYDPDATHWSFMKSGGEQDIGVTAAWSMLEAAHRLNNKVLLAIFDGGLVDHGDMPPGAIWLSPPGKKNGAKCVGPNGSGECPWHGTGVASVAFAKQGNGFGSAGVAGKSVVPMMVASPSDVWTFLKYILVDLPVIAVIHPKIINFSFGVRVPEGLNWVVNPPLDLLFIAIRELWGTLVVAAAGNEKQDVDETDDYGVFKVATWIPCQTSKVLCVGALQLGKNTRAAGYTNWANTSTHADHTNTVDLYAPGTFWVPVVNDNGVVQDEVKGSQGTSYAAPFVSGVAALVWAADPSLSANEVEHILLSTAHTGSSDGLVPRWVNAAAAVSAVLKKAAPVVTVSAPLAGNIDFEQNALVGVPLVASAVNGLGVPCCQIEWSSDVDGVLGMGTSLTVKFATPGKRVLTAKASDGNGTGTALVAIDVVNTNPQAVLVAPVEGQSVFPGVKFQLQAAVPLTGKTLTYRFLITGPDTKTVGPTALPVVDGMVSKVGSYTLVLEVTDNVGGKTLSAPRHFTCAAATKLTVTDLRLGGIVADSYGFNVNSQVSYFGNATHEIGAMGAHWIFQGDAPGCPAVTMSYVWGGTFVWTESAADCITEGTTGKLTLEVTDDAAQVDRKTVAIQFYVTPK